MSRPLVVAAHGTVSEAGRAAVQWCAGQAAAQLCVEHRVGYVDVCGPTLGEVLEQVHRPVVVPLFLATGYHVRHDVPDAVQGCPGATVTPALGAAPEVVAALADRVRGTGTQADAVVLAAAGSSHEPARAEVARAAGALGRELGVACVEAFLSGPGTRPQDAVTALQAQGRRQVVVAAHLLGPGVFLDRAHAVPGSAGGTQALATHPHLVSLVVRRYLEAVGAPGGPVSAGV